MVVISTGCRGYQYWLSWLPVLVVMVLIIGAGCHGTGCRGARCHVVSLVLQTIFRTVQFKYQLQLGDGKEAYAAMMAIPDYTL